jgi:hypothetical protein
MFRTFIAAAALAVGLTGGAGTAEQPSQPAADGCAGAYVIGPDDLLDVSVWGTTRFDVPCRSDPTDESRFRC